MLWRKKRGKNREQTEGEGDLMPQKHKTALKKDYKSSVGPGLSEADNDGYFDQVKALIKSRQKEMQSTKVIMTWWVRWKKPVKPAITLDTEDEENIENLESTGL